jgi:hypothetical protein
MLNHEWVETIHILSVVETRDALLVVETRHALSVQEQEDADYLIEHPELIIEHF